VSWGWDRDAQTSEISRGPWPANKTSEVTSRFVREHQWQGTRDISAFLAVPAAIDFQAEHDWTRVREECHELLREARLRIGELTGLEPICPDSLEWYAQMATIPLPKCDAEELKRRLYDEHRIEVPIIEWGRRQFVRLSIQGYNSREDEETLVSALRDLLAMPSGRKLSY
jgi:isopenicillin-N epimerase